jgi:DNA-binding protein WhiA
LYETARIRAENEDATLYELAQLHNPPITKSGVNHRLKKIMEFCGSDKNKPSEKQ